VVIAKPTVAAIGRSTGVAATADIMRAGTA
jgi:hypothetical protein